MKNHLITSSHQLIFILFLSLSSAYCADFIEGIDSTDTNGKGYKALFTITNGKLSGQVLALYCFEKHWCRGYFNYAFDDIIMAPDSVIAEDATTNASYDQQIVSRCFVIKDTSTENGPFYGKVQITKSLGGNRYAYRYFFNTQPNNKFLAKLSNDPKTRYKVNNLHFTGVPYFMHPDVEFYSRRLSWTRLPDYFGQPAKYIFYYSKARDIDTTKPLSPAEWDTVVIPGTATSVTDFRSFPTWGAFNMSVVYTDGRTSDLLTGFSICHNDIVNVKQPVQLKNAHCNTVHIRPAGSGYAIFNPSSETQNRFTKADFFNPEGRRVATLPCVDGTFFVTNQKPLIEGYYMVRLGTPNGDALAIPFMFTK